MTVVAQIVIRTMYFIAMVCAIVGMWFLFYGISNNVNLLQSDAFHSFGIGLAVVPAVIVRCLEKVLLG
jgi:hypothetical protein